MNKVFRLLVTSIATLGVGKLPKAPGTWGSALALLVWWAFMPENLYIQFTSISVAFFLGLWATAQYEKLTKKHDPKEVVVDELVGMWITLLFMPSNMTVFIMGFVLFRLFDIWKPFPIGWVDREVPGALGTMLDDVIAGIFALMVLLTMNHFIVS